MLRRITAAVLWAAGLAALAAGWIASGSALLLGAAIAVLLLPFLSLGLQYMIRRHIRVSLKLEPMVQKGAAAQAVLTVRNDALVSAGAVIRLKTRNALTHEETVSDLHCTVPPRGNASLRALVQSTHCGRITVSVERVSLRDVCGFLTVPVKTERISARTTVLPNMFPSEIALTLSSAVSDESESYAPDRRGGDFTELFQLREYVPGDSLRRMHWKLTAKTDRLIVREGSLPLQRSLLVFWDKTASEAMSPDAADALAESVSSVCQGLSEAGYAYTLGWSTEENIVLEETDDTDKLLTLLPRMISDAPEGKSGTAQLASDDAETAYGRVLLFAHAVPPETELETLCARSNVTLLLCSDEECFAPCTVIRFTPENYAKVLQNPEYLE